MQVALRAVMTAALLAAAAAARADDLCYGSAFLPEGNPIYEFQLTAHKSKTPQAFAARLSISARAPGIVYSTRGAALALQSKVGETDIDIFFDVATGGLIPTRLKAGVYYPTTIANPPRVVIQGPFGQIEGQAARPDPNLNDVYADFTLSRDQLRAFTPGARLDLAVPAMRHCWKAAPSTSRIWRRSEPWRNRPPKTSTSIARRCPTTACRSRSHL